LPRWGPRQRCSRGKKRSTTQARPWITHRPQPWGRRFSAVWAQRTAQTQTPGAQCCSLEGGSRARPSTPRRRSADGAEEAAKDTWGRCARSRAGTSKGFFEPSRHRRDLGARARVLFPGPRDRPLALPRRRTVCLGREQRRENKCQFMRSVAARRTSISKPSVTVGPAAGAAEGSGGRRNRRFNGRASLGRRGRWRPQAGRGSRVRGRRCCGWVWEPLLFFFLSDRTGARGSRKRGRGGRGRPPGPQRKLGLRLGKGKVCGQGRSRSRVATTGPCTCPVKGARETPGPLPATGWDFGAAAPARMTERTRSTASADGLRSGAPAGLF